MANQPPVRPWFRLTSLRSVSAPAQEPRPPLVQPTIRTNSSPSPPPAPPVALADRGSVPSSPAQKLPVLSSSLPTSPVQKASLYPPPPAAPAERGSVPSSPAQKLPVLSSSSLPTSVQKASLNPPPPAAPADRGSVPSSPAQKLPVLSSSSLPTSPVQKASHTISSSVPSSSPTQKVAQPPSVSSPAKVETTARGYSPSTKPMVQTPLQSPKPKLTTPPPSPLTLPPSQLKGNSEIEPKIPAEAESKNVIVQKTIEKPKQWLNGNSGEIQKTHNEKQKDFHRRLSESEDSGMRIITIAGENKGAYMELIESPNKHEFGNKPNYLYKKGNSKTKTENGGSESSSSDEGNVNRKQNKSNRGRTQSSYPMAAFMNSNVQCVNNSLLYNASCTHHDPGVRLSLSKKPFQNDGFLLKEVANGKHD